ncbi:phage portal protein [Dietzia sp. 179-F 9C3 NHS]|uniref:phage portal protein n=1 Tax=Dietzia sp. 179-F 9C3 NHS TaxID=3374295 RepID=UPI003879DA5E
MGIFQTLRTAARLPDLLATTTTPAPVSLASPWSRPNHLQPIVAGDLFDADRLPMTREAAMKVPAVARSRRLICTTIPRFPLVAIDRDGEPLAEQPPFLTRSDGTLSPYHRLLWTIDDLLFYGWSLWAVRRYADTGKVSAAERIPRARWTFDADGHILLDGDPADPDTVLLFPGLDEGLLSYGDRAVRHADRLARAADTAAETPMANLELHQTSTAPMSDEEIDRMIARWAAARRGKNGGVAYTNHAIELREHGAASEHLLIEGRNAAAVDVARAIGIPAAMIDATGPSSSLTYQTVQSRNAEFLDYGLAPFMSAVTARLGMDDVVAAGVSVRFDLGGYVTPVGTTVSTPDDHTPPPADGGALDLKVDR